MNTSSETVWKRTWSNCRDCYKSLQKDSSWQI